jgi:hypothetical protein
MKARRHNTSATQKGNLMQITKQLAVFLHNKPGTLAGMCRELGKNRINIHALSVSDTVDHAVVRMVVNDPMRSLTSPTTSPNTKSTSNTPTPPRRPTPRNPPSSFASPTPKKPLAFSAAP